MKKMFAFIILLSLSFILLAEIRYYQELSRNCGDDRTMYVKIKNLDAKIKSALNDGVTDLFLDWDSNEIRFNDGYVVCSVAPSIITRVERYAFLTWQEASDILKELYWKASSLGYLSIKERRGDLIIQICENIQDKGWAKRVALGNYQKYFYDCKEGKEVRI